MAAPTVKWNEAGGYFDVRFRTPDGKSRRGGRYRVSEYGGKRAAKEAADKRAADLLANLSGSFVDTKRATTLAAYGDAWFERGPRRVHGKRPMAPGTVYRYLSTWKRYVRPYLGHYAINKITPAQCADFLLWVEDKSKQSPYVSRNAQSVLHRLLRDAKKAGLIASNPSDDPEHPSLPKVQTIIARPEQIPVIAEGMPERFRTLIYLAATTAMRLEEVLGLRAHRIAWLAGQIVIEGPDCTTTEVKGRMIDGPAKTDAGNRRVPVPEPVLNMLARHIERYGLGDGGRVFHGAKHGGPICRSSLRDAWLKAVADVLPGFKLEELRHSAASIMAEGEYDLNALMQTLGHTELSTTKGYIRKLHPEQIDTLGTKVSTAFDGILPATPRIVAVQ